MFRVKIGKLGLEFRVQKLPRYYVPSFGPYKLGMFRVQKQIVTLSTVQTVFILNGHLANDSFIFSFIRPVPVYLIDAIIVISVLVAVRST